VNSQAERNFELYVSLTLVPKAATLTDRSMGVQANHPFAEA
jgi:hypothetical protein